MRYYRVPILTTNDGLEPELPFPAPWIGTLDGDGYLIKTPVDLGLPAVELPLQLFGEIPLNLLCSFLDLRGFECEMVRDRWALGGEV